jgi:hypothetical protein
MKIEKILSIFMLICSASSNAMECDNNIPIPMSRTIYIENSAVTILGTFHASTKNLRSQVLTWMNSCSNGYDSIIFELQLSEETGVKAKKSPSPAVIRFLQITQKSFDAFRQISTDIEPIPIDFLMERFAIESNLKAYALESRDEQLNALVQLPENILENLSKQAEIDITNGESFRSFGATWFAWLNGDFEKFNGEISRQCSASVDSQHLCDSIITARGKKMAIRLRDIIRVNKPKKTLVIVGATHVNEIAKSIMQ